MSSCSQLISVDDVFLLCRGQIKLQYVQILSELVNDSWKHHKRRLWYRFRVVKIPASTPLKLEQQLRIFVVLGKTLLPLHLSRLLRPWPFPKYKVFLPSQHV